MLIALLMLLCCCTSMNDSTDDIIDGYPSDVYHSIESAKLSFNGIYLCDPGKYSSVYIEFNSGRKLTYHNIVGIFENMEWYVLVDYEMTFFYKKEVKIFDYFVDI